MPIRRRRRAARITYGVVGTFDSLNPFILKGGSTSARGLRDPVFGNLVFESLLARSDDEPFTLYGLIAETVETPPDRGWVEFTLNPKARFSDGQPVTVDDVVFSLELLRDKGLPNYRGYYSKVESIERIGERGVRFHIEHAHDRELPLILGLMPVLPKHAIDPAKFDQSTLTPIIGIGSLCPHRGEGAGPRRLQAQPGLLGQGLADQARLRQLRRDPRSSSIATPAPCSRRSRKASTTSIPRATRRSGTPPTTSPP